MPMTQPEIMLQLLRTQNGVTTDFARAVGQMMNVPDAVYRLRRMGYKIEKEIIKQGKRNVARYKLDAVASKKRGATFVKRRP